MSGEGGKVSGGFDLGYRGEYEVWVVLFCFVAKLPNKKERGVFEGAVFILGTAYLKHWRKKNLNFKGGGWFMCVRLK